MTDLRQYDAVRNSLCAGDVVVFWGSTVLSRMIELPTEGPSHVAIVRWGVTEDHDVEIEESTIEGNRNGVQHNPLGWTLANYPHGSSAAALLLNDATRAKINWHKFYDYIGSIDGRVHYDIPGLFRFLLPEALDRPVSVTDKMVCSVAAGRILIECEAIEHVNWAECKPQTLVELGIYKPDPLILLGSPRLHNFNLI